MRSAPEFPPPGRPAPAASEYLRRAALRRGSGSEPSASRRIRRRNERQTSPVHRPLMSRVDDVKIGSNKFLWINYRRIGGGGCAVRRRWVRRRCRWCKRPKRAWRYNRHTHWPTPIEEKKRGHVNRIFRPHFQNAKCLSLFAAHSNSVKICALLPWAWFNFPLRKWMKLYQKKGQPHHSGDASVEHGHVTPAEFSSGRRPAQNQSRKRTGRTGNQRVHGRQRNSWKMILKKKLVSFFFFKQKFQSKTHTGPSPGRVTFSCEDML